MKPFAALAALTIALAAASGPAFARDAYVIDNAHLLSTAATTQLNTSIASFNAETHKEVVVDIVPSFTGAARDAEEQAFAQNAVNGVLIFIAKSPKTISVIPDRAGARFFPPGTTSAIRQAIASAFNTGDYDGGVTNGVNLIMSDYRSHLGAVRTRPVSYAPVSSPAVVQSQTGGGFNMSIILWLIALAVIFFIVRGIFRAIAGPRMMPPGYGGGQMGGPMGYGGGPGYGPGYGGGGFGGGGGGFWSGMLGGLGGAFLGNELFGNRNEGFNQNNFGNQAGFGGGDTSGGYVDNSGFQSDAGQADMGNASSGGWGGDSGGGWGGGGDSGGGDSGGGWGGGDSGGGGGDSGGGW